MDQPCLWFFFSNVFIRRCFRVFVDVSYGIYPYMPFFVVSGASYFSAPNPPTHPPTHQLVRHSFFLVPFVFALLFCGLVFIPLPDVSAKSFFVTGEVTGPLFPERTEEEGEAAPPSVAEAFLAVGEGQGWGAVRPLWCRLALFPRITYADGASNRATGSRNAPRTVSGRVWSFWRGRA